MQTDIHTHKRTFFLSKCSIGDAQLLGARLRCSLGDCISKKHCSGTVNAPHCCNRITVMQAVSLLTGRAGLRRCQLCYGKHTDGQSPNDSAIQTQNQWLGFHQTLKCPFKTLEHNFYNSLIIKFVLCNIAAFIGTIRYRLPYFFNKFGLYINHVTLTD